MAGIEIGDPVTLTNVLASNNVIPGDTLLLRAMTYTGTWFINFSGNAGNYITIKNYPGERAIIDGLFRINSGSDYIDVRGLEFTNNTNRARNTGISTIGVDCLGNYNRVINCLIHDHDQGITTSRTVTGNVYYGNLMYFNGWDSQLGHGIYPQNNAGNTKTIKHNLIFDNFGYGIHAYGSDEYMSDFIIDGNTSFDNGEPRSQNRADIFNGGGGNVINPIIRNNMTYRTVHRAGMGGACQLGNSGNELINAQVYDNYFVNTQWAMIFYGTGITRFDGNTMYGTLVGANLDDYPDNILAASYPVSGNHIVVQANEYDANRAQLTIYNWDLANTVNVDLTSLGWTGQCTARNVQDYWNDVQTLTISGGSITVNMQAINRTVASPVGWSAPATTYPQFGCMVLEKV